MDIDTEIQQRLKDTEDHFTERKETAHEHRIRETMVAFANSAIPDKPGIIFIGVTDKGEIKGVDNPDKTQKDISSWAKSCFPPLPVIPRVVQVEGRSVVAVVVEASVLKPHFAKAAYKRIGSQNFQADQSEIDEWIAYRNSITRAIIDQKQQGKHVWVKIVRTRPMLKDELRSGSYEIIACNSHYVILKDPASDKYVSEPLSMILLKWSPARDCLTLIVKYS